MRPRAAPRSQPRPGRQHAAAHDANPGAEIKLPCVYASCARGRRASASPRACGSLRSPISRIPAGRQHARTWPARTRDVAARNAAIAAPGTSDPGRANQLVEREGKTPPNLSIKWRAAEGGCGHARSSRGRSKARHLVDARRRSVATGKARRRALVIGSTVATALLQHDLREQIRYPRACPARAAMAAVAALPATMRAGKEAGAEGGGDRGSRGGGPKPRSIRLPTRGRRSVTRAGRLVEAEHRGGSRGTCRFRYRIAGRVRIHFALRVTPKLGQCVPDHAPGAVLAARARGRPRHRARSARAGVVESGPRPSAGHLAGLAHVQQLRSHSTG